MLFTPAWWNAASQRAAYTALAALSGLILLHLSGEVTVGYVVSSSSVPLGFVISGRRSCDQSSP